MRMGRWAFVAVCVALAVGCGKPKTTPGKTAPVDEAAASVALPNGWFATYTGPGGVERTGFVPTPAFAVGAGESIHPGLPSGAFEAAFSASIRIDAVARYRFGGRIEGCTLGVSVYNATGVEVASVRQADRSPALTAWVGLSPGSYTVTYRVSGKDGASRLQPIWEMERAGSEPGFRPEIIPSSVVSGTTFTLDQARRAHLAFRGRVLLGEMGCNHCHASEGGHTHGTGDEGSGLLVRRPPLLGEIGRRASPAWLSRWVADPQGLKPGSGMPGLFSSGGAEGEVDTIVHYLVSLGGPTEFEHVATEERVLARGREVYHSVGCVACHGALDSPATVFEDRALSAAVPAVVVAHPLGDLSGKWRAAALSEFLREPARTHPGGRMPSLSLSNEESDLLATYLVTRLGGPAGGAFEFDPAKVERGRASFAAQGCASCHEIGHAQAEVASTRQAKPMKSLSAGKGCLDPSDRGTPRYTLSGQDRAAIEAALSEISAGVSHPSRMDHTRLTMEALNCRACHVIDGKGGPPAELATYFRTLDEVELGDEGRLPPNLSNVGWKLQTGWLREVLTGAGRARPYMAARMPQFGHAAVGGLAEGLGAIAGVFPGTDTLEAESTDEMVLAGLTLAGDAGLNCISCHVFGDLPPAGTPGPAMTTFAARLRHDWYSTYMHAPQRFKPGTRMSTFFADGRSAVTGVLAGDADRQVEALWAYFNLGGFMPVPSGLATGDAYALSVGDEPRVFRTFLRNAGSRGIAVGYPLGMHFAFDAGSVRLVEAWRGDFIDASGAWKGRGGTVATGQGQTMWSAPNGPAIIVSPMRPAAWPKAIEGTRFRGYRLQGKGAPVFEWSIGDVSVEEVFEPAAAGSAIHRRFTVTGVPPGSVVWFNAGAGVESHKVLANVFEVRHEGNGSEQVIGHVPARDDEPVSFEVVIRP